jgi:hypothetical protein
VVGQEWYFVALREMLKHWSPGMAASLIEPLSVEQQVVAG